MRSACIATAGQLRQLIEPAQDDGGYIGPGRLAAERLQYLVDAGVGQGRIGHEKGADAGVDLARHGAGIIAMDEG